VTERQRLLLGVLLMLCVLAFLVWATVDTR